MKERWLAAHASQAAYQGSFWAGGTGEIGVLLEKDSSQEEYVKKLSMILALAILLGGGAVPAMSSPSYAQGIAAYNYPPPPPNIYATPWVGPNTPWVYYNGDWFLNGVLYYFFGKRHGWAPYYAYSPTFIVRPKNWYGSRWNAWYQGHPHYWEGFHKHYPYWHGHRRGHHYDRKFYEKHHHGHGKGWHKGFHRDDRRNGRRHQGH